MGRRMTPDDMLERAYLPAYRPRQLLRVYRARLALLRRRLQLEQKT